MKLSKDTTKCLQCGNRCENIIMQEGSVFCSVQCAELFRARKTIRPERTRRGHYLGPGDL
jgi:hypothetical protein